MNNIIKDAIQYLDGITWADTPLPYMKTAIAALRTMEFIENSVLGKQKLSGEYAYTKFKHFIEKGINQACPNCCNGRTPWGKCHNCNGTGRLPFRKGKNNG